MAINLQLSEAISVLMTLLLTKTHQLVYTRLHAHGTSTVAEFTQEKKNAFSENAARDQEPHYSLSPALCHFFYFYFFKKRIIELHKF